MDIPNKFPFPPPGSVSEVQLLIYLSNSIIIFGTYLINSSTCGAAAV